MVSMRGFGAAFAAAALLLSAACKSDTGTGAPTDASAVRTIPVVIKSSAGSHQFTVEVARTAAEQERGLMFRTNIGPDGGMMFAPYPAEGGPPKVASFWMKNTPTPLDIIFIRPDGTIANIAENTMPFSEQSVSSEGPVAAVLEIVGGRSGELGISPGDKVTWQH